MEKQNSRSGTKEKIEISFCMIPATGGYLRLFLLRKKSASIAFWYQNAACRENPDPNAVSGRKVDG